MSALLESVATQVATVVERIRDLEARADAAEDEAIRCRYEAARLIAEELERRGGGVRALAAEIGKSHTHVERMERVHRLHGRKPRVTTISAWNKLYKGPAVAAVNWPKRPRSIAIRTPGGYLAEAVQAAKSAVRTNDPVKVARALIDVVGEDVVRRALDRDAP
jgi:hypothetical protein